MGTRKLYTGSFREVPNPHDGKQDNKNVIALIPPFDHIKFSIKPMPTNSINLLRACCTLVFASRGNLRSYLSPLIGKYIHAKHLIYIIYILNIIIYYS
jgi:hypothetical protein